MNIKEYIKKNPYKVVIAGTFAVVAVFVVLLLLIDQHILAILFSPLFFLVEVLRRKASKKNPKDEVQKEAIQAEHRFSKEISEKEANKALLREATKYIPDPGDNKLTPRSSKKINKSPGNGNRDKAMLEALIKVGDQDSEKEQP